jgi:Tol biopolymer transport system component
MCTAALPSRPAHGSLDDQFVAFASDRDGHSRRYARSQKGGALLRLAQDRHKHLARLLNADAVEPIVWSPDRKHVAFYDVRRRALAVVRADGSAKRLIARKVDYPQLAWSPTGQWIALERSIEINDESASELLVIDQTGRQSKLPPMQQAGNSDWSPNGTCIAFIRQTGNPAILGDSSEAVWVADVRDGTARKLVEVQDPSSLCCPIWSSSGRFIAYTRDGSGTGSDPDGVVVIDVPEGREHALLTDADTQGLAWSNTRDVLAVPTRDGYNLTLFRPNGKTNWRTPLPKQGRSVGRLIWSPSGDAFAFEQSGAIYVASIASPRARLLSDRGQNTLIEWIAEPRQVVKAPLLPPTELAAGHMLLTRGKIEELSADGRQSAAVVASTPLDCTHIVAWKTSSRRAIRFEPVASCAALREGNYPDNSRYDVEVDGTRISWRTFFCGNDCYVNRITADPSRPGETSGGSDGGGEEVRRRPNRPPPPHEIRRGVELRVETAGIVLRRLSDGLTRSIGAPGGVVDAELETSGLFYAYNDAKADMPGHVVFVPFGRLFG